jgi:hypothetical protein
VQKNSDVNFVQEKPKQVKFVDSIVKFIRNNKKLFFGGLIVFVLLLILVASNIQTSPGGDGNPNPVYNPDSTEPVTYESEELAISFTHPANVLIETVSHEYNPEGCLSGGVYPKYSAITAYYKNRQILWIGVDGSCSPTTSSEYCVDNPEGTECKVLYEKTVDDMSNNSKTYKYFITDDIQSGTMKVPVQFGLSSGVAVTKPKSTVAIMSANYIADGVSDQFTQEEFDIAVGIISSIVTK